MGEIFSLKDEYRENKGRSKFEKRSFNFYYNHFKRLYCSVYEWTLPNGLNSDVIENYLFEDGFCLIWRHDVLGLVCTRGEARGFDINNRPLRFRPQFDVNIDGIEIPDSDLTLEECVPIYDTSIIDVKRSDAMFLIGEIVDIGETIRMQTFNQKTPLLAVSGTQQQKQKNLIDIKNIRDNAKVLFVDSSLSEIKALNFNAPFNVETLNALRNVRINEILENAGIDSSGLTGSLKKERLISDEIENNDEKLNYILADGLKARRKACEGIEKLTGEKASVTIQDIVRPMMAGDGSYQQESDNGNDNEKEDDENAES